MRILHIVNDLATGGTEHLLVKHAQQLDAREEGFQSDVVVLGSRQTARLEYVERLPRTPRFLEFPGRYRDPLGSATCLHRLRKAIRAVQPDLLHSYLWNANVFTELARVQLSIPHVVHVVDRRGDRNDARRVARSKVRLTGRLLTRGGMRFVAVSDACRAHAMAHWLVQPESIVTAHNGIPVQEFAGPRRSRATETLPVLGTISNFKEEKGHRFLLEAIALLDSRGIDVTLRIAGAGRGTDEATLKALVESMGIGERVEFSGQVDSAAEFYRSIDLFVIPSIEAEGLPTTILEAMASGLPIVATDVGGAVEAVRNGKDGVIVPARDSVALANAIASIATDRDNLLRLGEAGKARVREQFTIEGMTRVIVEQVYRPLLAMRGGRSS